MVRRRLRVGTDFSGLEAPLIALYFLLVRCGIELDHEFSCDNMPACQRMIAHCHNPAVLYASVQNRDVFAMSKVDLYLAGFPCQAYSTLGLQQVAMHSC